MKLNVHCDPWFMKIPHAGVGVGRELSPWASTLEAHTPRTHAPQWEEPMQREAGAPQREAGALQLEAGAPQLEKACTQQQRPSMAKNR